MRRALVVHMFMVTCVFIVHGKQEDWVIMEGASVGPMSTLVNNLRSYVTDIQADSTAPYRLLLADTTGIQVFDGSAVSTLVGGSTHGYREGVGDEALFEEIYGFQQLESQRIPPTLILPDHWNQCVRAVERATRRTRKLAGTCGTSGYRDGLDALFNGPYSIVQDPDLEHKLIVTDYYNHALRLIDMSTGITSTLVKDQVTYLRSIIYDPATRTYLVTSRHAVSRYDPATAALSTLSGGNSRGFADGPFMMAQYNYPSDLVLIAPQVIAVADRENHVLRVLNMNNAAVWSFCVPLSRDTADGSALNCGVPRPIGLGYINGTLYVGQHGSVRAVAIGLGTSVAPAIRPAFGFTVTSILHFTLILPLTQTLLN